jgi:hypothetical protein
MAKTRLQGAEAQRFIQRELREFAVNSEIWEVIHRSPESGEFWLETFPHSELHGGGPPDPEPIAEHVVVEKLKSEDGWVRHEGA